MYYTTNDIIKINNLFKREKNINFRGVHKSRLYKTVGEGGGGGASGKDPKNHARLKQSIKIFKST